MKRYPYLKKCKVIKANRYADIFSINKIGFAVILNENHATFYVGGSFSSYIENKKLLKRFQEQDALHIPTSVTIRNNILHWETFMELQLL